MIKTIGVLKDGEELFSEENSENDIFGSLNYFLESDATFLMNTMKIFSEELIAHVLFSKAVVDDLPLFFIELKPAGFLHNIGNYYLNILHVVNHLDSEIYCWFSHVKQCFNSENSVKEILQNRESQYFSCNDHQVHETCPQSGNSTFRNNFVLYLAYTVGIACLAYVSGIAEAPMWITVEIAAMICRVYERLSQVGGWETINLLCKNLTDNSESVKNIQYIPCY